MWDGPQTSYPPSADRRLPENATAAIKVALGRGRPLGEAQWVEQTAARLHLTHTLRREGRPKKNREN